MNSVVAISHVVANSMSLLSLPRIRIVTIVPYEKLAVNIPLSSFLELVSVTRRSLQAIRMVIGGFKSLSQLMLCDNLVNSKFKCLCEEEKVQAALGIIYGMQRNGVYVDSFDIIRLMEVCVDFKFLGAVRLVK